MNSRASRGVRRTVATRMRHALSSLNLVKCWRNRRRRYSEDASSIHPCSSSRSNLYWPYNRGFQFRLKEKKKLKAARWTYLSTGLLRESAAMIIKVRRRFRGWYRWVRKYSECLFHVLKLYNLPPPLFYNYIFSVASLGKHSPLTRPLSRDNN